MEVYGNLFPHTFRTYSASITLLALVEPFHAFHSHYKCKDVFDSSTDLAAALCLFDPVTLRRNKPFFLHINFELNDFFSGNKKEARVGLYSLDVLQPRSSISCWI